MDVIFALLGDKFGWKTMRIICCALILLGVVMLTTPFIFHGFTFEGWREVFSDFFLIFMLIWFGVFGNILIPTFSRRISRARTAFANPTVETYWATVQPTSDTAALVLPTSIDLDGRHKVALGWAVAVYAISALALLLAQVIAVSFALDGRILLLFALFSVLYTVGAAIFVAEPPHQTIRITEAGLTVRSIESRTIAWDKACVFALVEGGKRPGSTAIYILSSGRNSVRWSYRPRTRWYSVTTPTTSDEEYRRQINALLSYIATRTGLPLLDLR